AEAELHVSSRTKALVLQHTFGIPADLDAASAFRLRHGLVLIEDCVHALGARYRGQMLGSVGDAAFFSTEETKTISSTMGGMVTTNDAEIAAAMRRFQAECVPPPRSLARRYLLKFAAYHLLTQPRLYRFARPLYEKLGRRNPLPAATSSGELRGE